MKRFHNKDRVRWVPKDPNNPRNKDSREGTVKVDNVGQLTVGVQWDGKSHIVAEFIEDLEQIFHVGQRVRFVGLAIPTNPHLPPWPEEAMFGEVEVVLDDGCVWVHYPDRHADGCTGRYLEHPNYLRSVEPMSKIYDNHDEFMKDYRKTSGLMPQERSVIDEVESVLRQFDLRNISLVRVPHPNAPTDLAITYEVGEGSSAKVHFSNSLADLVDELLSR